MRVLVVSILLWLVLLAPARAEPVAGLEDPAFRLPFERALREDDPAALRDLHAAAEAGNTAALLALPTVMAWMPPTGSLVERNRFRTINGVRLADALAAASPAAAAWGMGEVGRDMEALLSRAFALYAAGEEGKATHLFRTWINQTGSQGRLTPDFFEHPVPPLTMSFVLGDRLNDFIHGPPAVAEVLLASRVRVDDPAAWIALARFARMHVTDTPSSLAAGRLDRILRTARIPTDIAERRLEDAASLLRVTSADRLAARQDVAAAEAGLAAEPSYRNVVTLCGLACPETTRDCAAAYVAAFGLPGAGGDAQPFAAVLSAEAFFASLRGRLMLLRRAKGLVGPAPAESLYLRAARRIDTCLADAVVASMP